MASEPATTPAPYFTFRRCLLLCLPALAIGLALRVAFLISIPESYFGSDSNSYFETAETLWSKGDWKMDAKRRGLYPPFLVAATVLPGSTPQVVAVLQHALGLASLVGIGWVAGHCTRRWALWVPVVTILAAMLPQPLWFEHEMIADTLLLDAFILACALAFPIEQLRRPRPLLWFLLAAGLIVALKPHGRPLWLGLMIAAVFIAGNPVRWGWRCHAALAATLLVILTTGSSKQGGWLFLSSTLPLVETQGEKWQAYRLALAPLIAEARRELHEYPWQQGYFKKLLNNDKAPVWAEAPAWAELIRRENEFAAVCKGLALEAVRQNPATYTHFVLKKFGIAISKVDENVKFDPQRFWREQSEHNATRWPRKAPQLELLYERGRTEYEALVARRITRSHLLPAVLFAPAERLRWIHQTPRRGHAPALHWTWFGGLGVLGIVRCFMPSFFLRGLVLLLPLAIYLTAVYAIGDSRQRYLLPVEWIGVLLGVLGVDLILNLVSRFLRRPIPPDTVLVMEPQSAA